MSHHSNPTTADRAYALRTFAVSTAEAAPRRNIYAEMVVAAVLDGLAAPEHHFSDTARRVHFDDLVDALATLHDLVAGIADPREATDTADLYHALDVVTARADEALFRLLYGTGPRPCARCPRTVRVTEHREPIRPALPGGWGYCHPCQRQLDLTARLAAAGAEAVAS